MIDTMEYRDCLRTGREELIRRVQELCAELDRVRGELEKLLLPGWSCAGCGVFNGEAKEKRSECRACGDVRM